MTIVTKPKTDKKSDKPLEKPLVVNEVSGSECIDVGMSDRNDLGRMDMELWLSPSVRRRISTTTTVCVFITALIVMSICIIGGVYLYRQVTQHQRMSRFRGWCGIPYEKNALHFGRKDYRLGPNKPFFKEDSNAEWLRSHDRFREEFDIDLDTGLYERIDVPDFGYGRSESFIHDFKMNKTGIIDKPTQRCFIMPLDRKHVKLPMNMFDIVSKMWMGFDRLDTRVISKKMRIVRPHIEDLSTQGSFIFENCANFLTFFIVDANGFRERRDTDEVEEASDENTFRVAEFAGNNIIEYTIIES